MIQALKEDVAIWNINSVGEFFMQKYEKYKGEYHISLKKVRQAKREMDLAVVKEKLIDISTCFYQERVEDEMAMRIQER